MFYVTSHQWLFFWLVFVSERVRAINNKGRVRVAFCCCCCCCCFIVGEQSDGGEGSEKGMGQVTQASHNLNVLTLMFYKLQHQFLYCHGMFLSFHSTFFSGMLIYVEFVINYDCSNCFNPFCILTRQLRCPLWLLFGNGDN